MRLPKLIVTAALFAPLATAAPLGGTLTGRIVDWPPGQTGQVWLEGEGIERLSTGPIDAQGNFTLKLPPELLPLPHTFPSVRALFQRDPDAVNDPCEAKGTAAPTSARYHFFNLNAAQGGKLLGDLRLSTTDQNFLAAGDRASLFLFATEPFTVDSTISCPGFKERFDGQFAAGWNMPLRTVTQVTPQGVEVSTVTNAAPPPDAAWRLYNVLGGIGIQMGRADGGGTLIESVRPGGPAQQAGIESGDVIVSIDGQDVTKLPIERIARLVQGQPGTKVTLGVTRFNKPGVHTIEVIRAPLRVP